MPRSAGYKILSTDDPNKISTTIVVIDKLLSIYKKKKKHTDKIISTETSLQQCNNKYEYNV